MLLYSAVLGLCAGVAVALLFAFGAPAAGVCVALSAGLIVFSKFGGAKNQHYAAFALITAALLAAAAVGIVRTNFFLQAEQAHALASYAGETVTVVGVVSEDPDKRVTSLRATVVVSSIGGAEQWGTLIAVLPRESELSYGDTVELRGRVSMPESFETDAGREFDYASYLRARGVSVLLLRASVVRTQSGGWSLQKALFSLKHFFERSVESIFPEPQGALLEGILLGERRGIPQPLTDAFVQSGLIHIVVLSGYNISIVAEGVFRALGFLPQAVSFPLGGVLMTLFALMSGGGAATVRALIMALIALMARYFDRPALALRALCAAVAGMVLWNPLVLLLDPSFILSVLATFGLITLAPVFETKLQFLPSDKYVDIRSIAASTIAAQIFVLPALLYFTGVLSFLSLPANMLALPAAPWIMFSGFLAGLLNLLHPLLAFAPAVVADLLLRFMIYVATTTASLPFSSAVIPQFSAWLAALCYVPLTAVAIYLYRRTAAQPRPNSNF